MTVKVFDQAYHRSRVDVQIQGSIFFVMGIGVLALLIGDRFQPFHPGARWTESTHLVWLEQEQDWATEAQLVRSKNYPPSVNTGPLVRKTIYPIRDCVILVLGCVLTAAFTYTCAKRQAALMNAVFRGEVDQPYQRPWEDIRVTFWALDIALLFILFFFMAWK